MSLFLLWESVNSVALSHDDGHDCDVCKAANGDKDAWTRIVVQALAPSGTTEEKKDG